MEKIRQKFVADYNNAHATHTRFESESIALCRVILPYLEKIHALKNPKKETFDSWYKKATMVEIMAATRKGWEATHKPIP